MLRELLLDASRLMTTDSEQVVRTLAVFLAALGVSVAAPVAAQQGGQEAEQAETTDDSGSGGELTDREQKVATLIRQAQKPRCVTRTPTKGRRATRA